MKNILYLFLALLLLQACNKQLAVSPQTDAVTNNSNTVAASVPCTGNTWSNVAGWPFSPIIDSPHYLGIRFVCNNKIYMPAYGHKIAVYDGSSFTWINSAVPDDDFSYCYSFSVGNKGYLAINSAQPKKLWQYDPLTNTWTEKTAFAGPKRVHPATFVIGNKAYVTCGTYQGNYFKDLWEYNSVNDQWTQKASMPASVSGRTNATAFSIGLNGYVVGGGTGGSFLGPSNILFNTLLCYNQVFNSWSLQANYPGILGDNSISFTSGDYGYAGLDKFSLYRYSPVTNSWLIRANYPGTEYRLNSGVTYNNRGYVLYSGTMYKYTPQICGVGGTAP